jgi:ABC-type antimicrobial peptide transport system permease subunit
MYARYLNGDGIDRIAYERLIVKMKDEKNANDIKELVNGFKFNINPDNLQHIDISTADFAIFDNIDDTLEIVFNTVIGITMFLCFFSLSSSMTANIMEQTKEIGILRSLGYTKSRITMLYIYESFILVIASSLLGVLIGFIVGSTMVY